MRLDKFLADSGLGSRKEVKALLKKGQVTVNGSVAKDGKLQVDHETDEICFEGEKLGYQAFYYYLLNKPQGVVSATQDNLHRTVLDLFASEDYRADLFPVGRLDKDTEGLLLISNDGELAHQLLSPKKHVEKEYFAKIDGLVTEADVAQFAAGLTLRSGEVVQPAKLTIVSVDEAAGTAQITLIIKEGKFHQVKRMFEAVGKQVTYLQRIRMGTLELDGELKLGEYRELTASELRGLQDL